MPEGPRLDSPDNDELVMSLVEMALSRPAEERERYVRIACSDQPQLFDEVWGYVQGEERMKGFLLDPLYHPPEDERPLKPEDLLERRFRIGREVGQGGMAFVYEAYDEKLKKRIAIKWPKTGFRKRLPPEVSHATEISHPNVCKVFEIHTAPLDGDEIDFLTMEFLEGETLAERLRRGPVGKKEAQTIAQQLCAGLAEAHRKRVIHGDLKSNNVILTAGADGALRAVITDFGLARRPEAQQAATSSEELGGTPDYMAPELWKGGKASVASDLYALGVILHELATGRRPHGPGVSWEERLVRKPRPAKHPWKLVLQRCLDPDPGQRFRTAEEVAPALEPSRRWFLIAAAVVLATASSVVTYRQARPPAPAPTELVRLAVLPFEADQATTALTEGLLIDTGERLSRVKSSQARLTVIPLADALQNRIRQPEQARSMLGATHVLRGEVHRSSDRVGVVAYLMSTTSSIPLKEWRAEYPTGELATLPVALAGMVTLTLHLPPLDIAATVSPSAYPDFAAGVALGRTDDGLDRALPLLERATALDPLSPLTHAKLAEVQIRKYRTTKDEQWRGRAVASLESAERLNPDVAVVRVISGMLHDFSGEYQEALADLGRATNLEPLNGDAWRSLAMVYEHNNQPNQALAAFAKAIELQPGYFKNYEQLGGFHFRRADYEAAVQEFKKMMEVAPDLYDSHYDIANAYQVMGRYAEAEYEALLSIKIRETSNAYHLLGVSTMFRGQEREAIRHYLRAKQIGPPTSLLYLNLGTAYRRSNQRREAEVAYQEGLGLAEAELVKNPRDAYVSSCLAYLCARLGERRRAEIEAARAMGMSAGAHNVRWMVILTYETLGLRDRILPLLQGTPESFRRRLNDLPDLADLRADSRFQHLLVPR